MDFSKIEEKMDKTISVLTETLQRLEQVVLIQQYK